MQTFQKILLVISAYNLIAGWFSHRSGKSSRYWFLLSSGIWGAILVLGGIAPTASTTIANWVGVGRGVDFAFYLSTIAIWSLLLRLIQKQSTTSRELTLLIREIAIREANTPGPRP